VISGPSIEFGEVTFQLLGVGELSPEEVFDCIGVNVANMAFEGREPILLETVEVVVNKLYSKDVFNGVEVYNGLICPILIEDHPQDLYPAENARLGKLLPAHPCHGGTDLPMEDALKSNCELRVQAFEFRWDTGGQ
jgi:hypothetical protein